jgi:beta-phosphoglucomutase-like phosphatase (HAD superfamily)
MPKRYKGIIFDFNGVLIFDSHLQELSWQKVLSKITKKNIPINKIRSFIHGRCVKDVFETFLKRKLLPEELKILSNEKERYYRALCLADKEHFRLAKGAENFLNWLINSEVPIGIATSAGKDNIDFYFKHLNLSTWFNRNFVVYDDGTIKTKPAPDPYLLAAKKLQLEPSECIAIEDSNAGIKSAKAAKIGYIIAVSAERAPDRFIKKNANLIINTFEDLMFKLKEESR